MSIEASTHQTEARNSNGIGVLTSAVFVAVMTASMVNVLMPTMGEEFGASEAQIGWVVTGFMLVMAIGVPLYGRISDFFSLRRLFPLALSVFAVGGLICALASNLPVLVFGRIVQAAGDAAIPALATVAVTRILPPGNRGGALGIISSSVGIGAVAGPIVGGVVGQLFGWRFLFLGSLVLMLLLIPGAIRVLPDGGSEDGRRFDLAGGVLLGLAAGLFLFGITQGQVAGFTSFTSWGSFLGATLAALSFTWRIASVAHPFVSPDLFRNRAYVAAVLVGCFSMLGIVSMFVFVPLLVAEANGLSPAAAGLGAGGGSNGDPLPMGWPSLRPHWRKNAYPGWPYGDGVLDILRVRLRGRRIAASGLAWDVRGGSRLRPRQLSYHQRRS